MRFVWGRGAAVAGSVAVIVLVAGCGSGGDDAGADAPPSPSVSASVEAVDTAPTTEVTEPEYPAGPEGDIDRRSDAEGWVFDELYALASEFVQDMCDSLPVSAKDGSSRPQWLVEGGYLDGDGAAILKFGVPRLCPEWATTVTQAVSGDYERWISTGEYVVKNNPKPYDSTVESERQEIGPGTYRAVGEVSDCYWERTAKDGTIIDNQFVTQATELTVTLRVGELFKNDCGSFRPVS